MKLPTLEWHNHPDFPSVKWTELELDAINKHALAVANSVRAECVRICDEREPYPSLTPRHCAEAIKSLEIEP